MPLAVDHTSIAKPVRRREHRSVTDAGGTTLRRWRIGTALVLVGWVILLGVVVFGSVSPLTFALETLIMLCVVGMAIRVHRRAR